jgi:hypothetical protein
MFEKGMSTDETFTTTTSLGAAHNANLLLERLRNNP